MSDQNENATAIIPQVVEPLITADEAKIRMEKIQNLKKSLLDETDYQEFQTKEGPKKFVKKSGWRKLAGPFNISDEIVKEYKEEVIKKREYNKCVCGYKTDNPKEINTHMQAPHKEAVTWTVEEISEPVTIWRIHAKATYPNGRSAIGIAAASSDERDYSHEEHDLYSLAHTRAKNRAISDLIGLGEVSAEEMSGRAMHEPKTAQAAQGGKKVLGNCAICHDQVQEGFEWSYKGDLVHKVCVPKGK